MSVSSLSLDSNQCFSGISLIQTKCPVIAVNIETWQITPGLCILTFGSERSSVRVAGVECYQVGVDLGLRGLHFADS